MGGLPPCAPAVPPNMRSTGGCSERFNITRSGQPTSQANFPAFFPEKKTSENKNKPHATTPRMANYQAYRKGQKKSRRQAVQRSRVSGSRASYTVPYRTSGYAGRFGAGGELKFKDTTYSASAPATTGTITNNTLVGTIAEGTGESERIGRKITVRSVFVKGWVYLPSGTTLNSSGDIVRIIVYQDKQANGAAATVANILDSTDVLSFMNLENSLRFRILKEKVIAVNTMGLGAFTGPTYGVAEKFTHFKMAIKCNMPIEFKGNTPSVADLTSNNIGIMAISESAVATLQYYVRVRYKDQ